MNTSIKYTLLTITAAILALFSSSWFHSISLSMLDLTNSKIVTQSIGGTFLKSIFFWIAIGILPVLVLLVKRLAKMKTQKQSFLALLIIVLSGIILWQFHIFRLNQNLLSFKGISDHHISNSIDISQIHFARYLLIGFFLGTFISIVVFRRLNKVK